MLVSVVSSVLCIQNVDFTGPFENMHPEVHLRAHSRFCPELLLDVGLELMEKWALRFDETQVVYSNSFKNDIGFASGENFGHLEERFC